MEQVQGVLVNNTLTWLDHISMVCSKVSRSLNLLSSLLVSSSNPLASLPHTFFPPSITVTLSGLGALNMKLVNWKPYSTSLAEQSCGRVETIQLLLLAEN